jgi:hypothetical protein
MALPPAAARAGAPRQPSSSTLSGQSALAARVDAWWKAREERDHLKMYELFDPEYRRSTPFAKFLQESAVRTRYEIVSHRITRIEARGEDRVVVTLEVGSSLTSFGGPFPVTVEEAWVRADGEWFKVHEPFKAPFPESAPG